MAKIDSEYSLIVYIDDNIVFKSKGKWLYPLFELEDYIRVHKIEIDKSLIVDKVIGKASAFLIARLGVCAVHGILMSELAIVVFNEVNIPFRFDQLVKRIECKTEAMLKDVSDPEEAYLILRERL